VQKAGTKNAVAALVAHPDPMVAALAARAVGDRAAAAAVFDRALAATEVATRVGVVNLLAQALTAEAARARATAALRDPAPTVVLAAARALAYLDDRPAAIAALATIVASGAPIDRAHAAAELARLGDARGRAALDLAAGDADPEVRRAVIDAHLGAGTVTPSLWGALADDQADNRLAAAITILTLQQ
jgi:HEAT repeat protein